MPAIESDICFWGKDLAIEHDFQTISSIEEAKALYAKNKFLLTIIDWEAFQFQIEALVKFFAESPQHIAPIVLLEDYNFASFKNWLSDLPVSNVVAKADTSKLNHFILQGFEKLQLKKQEDELLALMAAQSQELESLSQSFEDKLEERKHEVEKARRKVNYAQKRLEATQRIIVALYTADSIGEMERLLVEAMTGVIDLYKIKLSLGQSLQNQEEVSFKTVMEYDDHYLGDCLFYAKQSLKKSEEVWLQQITDLISIAVDRWLALEKSLTMKDNWEASFRAIPTKIAVIGEDYSLLAYNHQNQTSRRKCYQALYNLEQPCFGCKLGKDYQITHLDNADNDLHIYEVKSQAQLSETDERIFVNIYEDITHRARLGRLRVEAAKLAELGLIGSSIAHELNNPLSGVLSYIQILLSEDNLPNDLQTTLQEMEQGAKRCRDIIQNLLSFTRVSKSDEQKDFSAANTIDKALLLLDSKAKTLGLNISKDLNSEPLVFGSESMFLQAILEIIKNSLEDFSEILQTDKSFRPQLQIKQSQNADSVMIDIIDNGRGIPADKLDKVFTPLFTLKNPSHNRGLGLTTAYQILQSFNGRLEIFSVQPQGVQVRIVLPAKTF